MSLYALRGRLSSLSLSLPLPLALFVGPGPGRGFFLDRFRRGDYGPLDFDITSRASQHEKVSR